MRIEDIVFQYEADLKDDWQVQLELPEEWNVMKLADAVDHIDYGLSKAIPKSPPPNGIKIVSTADINREGDILYKKIRTTETSKKTIERLTLNHGDVLFNWRNSAELIGKTGVFESQSNPHIFASFILRIDCSNSEINNFFLKYLMRYYRERDIFINLSRRAVNQANYNKNEISQLRIPVPPIAEQKRIAYVLSIVQKAISQQEQIIQTTTELKKALMQKLFTEGLHGEKQKETAIGLIPESWDVIKFSDSVFIKQGQVDPKVTPYSEMLHVGSENIESNTGQLINLKTNKQAKISSGNYHFTPQDILYSKIRPYLNKVALSDFEGTCSADIYPIQSKQDFFTREFLFQFLLSASFVNQAKSFQDRTGIPKINRAQLGMTLLPLPSPTEQQEIAKLFTILDQKIAIHYQRKVSFNDLFRTLLHQLMTAQIRVEAIDLPGFEE